MGGRGSSKPDPEAQAAEALYGAPLASFTEERKRLSTELRDAGDAEAAKRFAKLPKPSVSAWVVNRLYRDARDDMDALIEAGQRMRAGEVAAGRDQRSMLARLNQRAGDILRDDGHAASPAMLRRVTMTLQALSAIGSFEPDAPGQLSQDRDPPGFDLLAGVPMAPPEKGAKQEKERKPARAAPSREEPPPDPAERRREQRAAAQLKMLERTATQAKRRADARASEVEGLREELERAEATAERLRAALKKAEAALEEARAASDKAVEALSD